MDLWIPNNKNRLRTVLLGNVPTSKNLKKMLAMPLPKIIEKMLDETHEDLAKIKDKYEELGVKVVSYPVTYYKENKVEDTINVRNGFLVVNNEMFVTEKLDYLKDFYSLIKNVNMVPATGIYCPNIYLHDDYAILDGLDYNEFQYWRDLLSSKKKKIITAFNRGHSDGIYCNVADKIWLTNGNALNFKKYWPHIPVMELSTTNSSNVNDWHPVERLFELRKTKGKFLVNKASLDTSDIKFVNDYLKNWVGYCEETLFDINMSIIDKNNVMVISKNSLVYNKLESLDIKVHKVPFRHRFFWDGGLHCITNDLVRENV